MNNGFLSLKEILEIYDPLEHLRNREENPDGEKDSVGNSSLDKNNTNRYTN